MFKNLKGGGNYREGVLGVAALEEVGGGGNVKAGSFPLQYFLL